MSLREAEALIIQLGDENAQLRRRNYQLLGENFRLRSEKKRLEAECTDLSYKNSNLQDRIRELECFPSPFSDAGEAWCNYRDGD